MLTQLAEPSLFNINIFTPDYWGSWPVTGILALVLICSFAVLWYFFTAALHTELRLLGLLAICWLPFGSSFFYHSSQTVLADLSNLYRPLATNITETMCQMDDVQHLQGFYCNLFEYLAQVQSLVPRHSKVKLMVNSSVSLYANYFLYDHFQLVADSKQADYLFIFFFDKDLSLSANGELALGSGQDKVISKGPWRKLSDGDLRVAILQHL